VISFPRGTKMFQFPRFPSAKSGRPALAGQVVPLGYLRLSLLDNAPELIAVLPRPSSAVDTKASTLRSCFLYLLPAEHKTLFTF
jgi:hypothetical protein